MYLSTKLRKENPESPDSCPEKPRSESPTVEASFFDPETVIIILQSQLKAYLFLEECEERGKEVSIWGFPSTL